MAIVHSRKMFII